MPTISLREYHQFIDTLIEKNSNSEAIDHCKNILLSYPKSIKTYQQLGQALLENKQFSEASDVFLKVLTVFPDDFIAHAGLSVVYEGVHDLGKAIWHMEQAFETQPSNPAIQDELQRLIGMRDGTAPAKIRLTRGALIRMYAKGELFQQVISETHSLLKTNPNRVDLKLLLAKMYTLTNANINAANICTEILQENPYCFEANRIMFELTSTNNDTEKYDPIFLQRLRELDPYYNYIETSSDNVKDIPADKIVLDLIETKSNKADLSTGADWLNSSEIQWEYQSSDAKGKSNAFIFDEEIFNNPVEPTPVYETSPIIEDVPLSTIAPTPDSDENELPEWIAKAGWIRAIDEDEAVATTEAQNESYYSEIDSEKIEAQPADDLPDWLKSVSHDDDETRSTSSIFLQESTPEDEIPPLPSEVLFDLLDNNDLDLPNLDAPSPIEQSQIVKPIEPIEEVTSEVETQIESGFIGSVASSEESVPDLPDWLKDLDTGGLDIELPEENASFLTPIDVEETLLGENSSEGEEILDFIEELGTGDLVGDLEFTSPDDQDREIESPTIAETEVKIPEALNDLNPLLEIDSTEYPSIQEPMPEKEPSPAVPSWVKNILSSSSANLPITNLDQTTIQSEIEETPITPMPPERPLNDILTDLLDVNKSEDVLAEELPIELETWIEEITPDKPEHDVNEPVMPEMNGLPEESTEIPMEFLIKPETDVEHDELKDENIPEVQSTEGYDETSTVEKLSLPEVSSEVEQTIPVIIDEEILVSSETDDQETDFERIVSILHAGEYSSFINEVSKTTFSDGDHERIIDEVRSELRENPTDIELWQTLGDMQVKKSNYQDAITSFIEAEKNLFY